MYSILTVTSAASSYDLTTLANVKDELGTDASSDAVLRRYITSASKAASQYCNRVFAVETVSEQFFLGPVEWKIRNNIAPLQLSRWPIITVTSVTEDDVLLVENTDYLVDSTNGQLTRINEDGFPIAWPKVSLVIVYSAGYATTPADVEDAIIRMVTQRYVAKGRDRSVRSEEEPGVYSVSYWVATGAEAGNLTPDVADVLDNYRTPPV
jgi:hypothetical protein